VPGTGLDKEDVSVYPRGPCFLIGQMYKQAYGSSMLCYLLQCREAACYSRELDGDADYPFRWVGCLSQAKPATDDCGPGLCAGGL
jgi:hypothetical protein